MVESLLIAVDAAPFADRVGFWLADLVGAGVRRATLFHAIEGTGAECVRELDELRPRLDRLAVQLSARHVEADIALKRGDRVRWLVSLAELKTCHMLVLGPSCSRKPRGAAVGSTLRRLVVESHVPLLIIGSDKDPARPALTERPHLLAGKVDDALVEAHAKTLLGGPLKNVSIAAGEPCPPGASLLVTGPEPAADALERLIAQATCPVLVFPAPALAVQPEGGPSTAFPPSEVPGARRNAGLSA